MSLPKHCSGEGRKSGVHSQGSRHWAGVAGSETGLCLGQGEGCSLEQSGKTQRGRHAGRRASADQVCPGGFARILSLSWHTGKPERHFESCHSLMR